MAKKTFKDPRKDSATNNSYTVRPIQRLSWNEKTKEDYEWWKMNIDYYINASAFQSGFSSQNRDLLQLYQIHNSILPDEWFNHVINPLNSTKKEYQSFPAKLRSINIARPVINELEGEYIKRPFNPQVTASGEDAYSDYLEQLNEQIVNNLHQHFLNELIQKGVAEGDIQNIPLPDKLKEYFESNYKDKEAIDGQRLLEMFFKDKYFFEETRRMFKDWLIAGEAYSYKNIENDDITYQRVSPLDIWYVRSPNSDYLEDCEAVVKRITMTFSEVYDLFYRDLSEEELDEVDRSNITNMANTFFRDYTQNDLNNNNTLNRVLVFHITWKSQEKRGMLTYIDPDTGSVEQMEVDENYKLNKEAGDIEIDWFWVNVAYEGYKINNTIYSRMRKVPVQRNEANNLSKCKLPYNGRIWSTTHARAISIYEIMLDWVKLYIIAMYRTEMLLAKNMDKIILLDKAVIPNDEGWDEEKFFYYAISTGFALIDRSQIGVDKTFNQYQVLDARLYDSIRQMIELMEWIKNQCYDIVGVSQQRLSNIKASESVTNTQSAIFQSTVITEDLFTKFDELIVRDLQGILDLSKIAYSTGKKALYYSSNLQYELLDLNPEKFCSKELGIFVVNSSKETDKLNLLKQSVQAFSQNGSKPSTIVEILEASNVAKLKQTLKKIETIEMEQAAQNAESEQKHEQEMQAQQAALQKEFKAYESLLKINEDNNEYDRKEQLAFIEGEIKQNIEQIKLASPEVATSGDVNQNGQLDFTEIYKHSREREKMYLEDASKRTEFAIKQQELLIKQKEQESKHLERQSKVKNESKKLDLESDKLKVEKEKVKVERENMSNDLQIAKINAQNRNNKK